MKKALIASLLSISCVFADKKAIFDLENNGFEQYQDLYIQGKVVKKASKGERFMEERFAIVNSVLQRYQRPFTMLDVGAAQGYFCFRAAEMYPNSVFVMLEGSNPSYPKISKQLSSLFSANSDIKNVIWLDSPIIVEEIEKLSTCEHFDVILALHILHWFPQNWQRLLEALHSMSHVLIIEVPPIEAGMSLEQTVLRHDIHTHLSSVAKQIVKGVPRHTEPSLHTTYYILEKSPPFTLKTTTLLHPDYKDREHLVFYDYHSKVFHKKDLIAPFAGYETPWQPGINLLSYLMLRGAFPFRKDVANLLPKDKTHKDWMPNNMVLQGKKIELIDKDDRKNMVDINLYTNKFREKVEKFIQITSPEKIKKAFFRLQKDE